MRMFFSFLILGRYSFQSSNCGLQPCCRLAALVGATFRSSLSARPCAKKQVFCWVWLAATAAHRLLPSVVELRPKGLVVARRAAPAFWT
ncbi:hypothetical protein SapgrDRAFT_1276 [Saprospira grandis DSM 2844]|uniref:Uncharacterized protein n=1 Tax=Saprospira grandis DSM 2844 TaxID=694433 RepID=J0NZM8_9BACT|nr:hypothetical protein SapgrDRAFT_1276 [Saprospira grandis DSM 2844]